MEMDNMMVISKYSCDIKDYNNIVKWLRLYVYNGNNKKKKRKNNWTSD